jgi:hypothetical protein
MKRAGLIGIQLGRCNAANLRRNALGHSPLVAERLADRMAETTGGTRASGRGTRFSDGEVVAVVAHPTSLEHRYARNASASGPQRA